MPLSYPFHDGRDGAKAAADAISRIDKEIGADNVAAIVIEPIAGEGGFIVPAAGFLPALVEFANANGIVFIADEIQTGFCRTGEWFACDHEGIVPDLITTAKGIAGGLPLAGVTGRAEIMDAVHAGGLGGTYGGNPVACAAALGSIATMEELDLNAARARDRAIMVPAPAGDRREDRRHRRRARPRRDDRGRDRRSPAPTSPTPSSPPQVAKACHAQGVVVLTAGTYGNVLRFLPPLTIPEHLLDEALTVLEDQFLALTGSLSHPARRAGHRRAPPPRGWAAPVVRRARVRTRAVTDAAPAVRCVMAVEGLHRVTAASGAARVEKNHDAPDGGDATQED